MASAIEAEVEVLENQIQTFRSHTHRLRALIFTAKKISEQRKRLIHHIENECLGRIAQAYERKDSTMIQLSINMVKELLVRMQNGMEIFPVIEKHIMEREIDEWNRLLGYLTEVKTRHVVNAGKEGYHDLKKVMNEVNNHYAPVSERTSSYLTIAINAWEGSAALMEAEIEKIRVIYLRLKKQVETAP